LRQNYLPHTGVQGAASSKPDRDEPVSVAQKHLRLFHAAPHRHPGLVFRLFFF